MDSVTTPPPIRIHIPIALTPFAVPLAKYLERNAPFTDLIVGACIFSPASINSQDPSSPRLLIVQRAATEQGFPNLWEVPGGAAEGEDPTILHSVAREVFEETSLKLTRFVRVIGDGTLFSLGEDRKCIKLTFEIQVQEDGGARPMVELNPEEHQAFKWVTEEELQDWGPGKVVSADQMQMMLQAFGGSRHADGR